MIRLYAALVSLSFSVVGVHVGVAYDEAKLERDYFQTIHPVVATPPKYFKGRGGISLAYKSVNTKAANAIVLVLGYSESFVQYGETVYDLQQLGYAVYIYDHRGMGLSDRLVANPQVVHVDSFDSYHKDLLKFIDRHVRPKGHAKILILAHSTGGLVSLLAAAQRRDFVDGMILSAPLIRIKTDIPEWLAYSIVTVCDWFGFGSAYVPTAGDRQPGNWQPDQSRTTTSIARSKIAIEIERRYPRVVAGGPSNKWLREAIRHTDKLQEKIPHLDWLNILIFQAGDEHYVHPEAQDRLCRSLKRCEIVRFPDARHEILSEADAHRDVVMRRIERFVGERS